jgi:tRNA pseudouridine38-40 synthase
MRIALGVEYDGSPFHGWQEQPGLYTVQSCLTEAISKIANHEIEVFCAGRTDTGVNATGQVIHFDSTSYRSTKSWMYGCNSNLPSSIVVRWAHEVNDEFHARYSAISRRYRYLIYNHSIRPALWRTSLTWHYRPLDHLLMQEAAQSLIGEHDFSSFRSSECQSPTPMRNVHAISVVRQGDLIMVDIKANAFLHHMVRNIVGCLMTVGSGKQPVTWLTDVLNARDRRLGAETAPPYGLYLVEVTYPDEFELPITELGPMIF